MLKCKGIPQKFIKPVDCVFSFMALRKKKFQECFCFVSCKNVFPERRTIDLIKRKRFFESIFITSLHHLAVNLFVLD